MENDKQPKLKNKIWKILPKAAAAVRVTFQNPPLSPGRDRKLRSSDNTTTRYKPHGNKGFSGPMIPQEARRKSKDGRSGIETQEPTSPKVSCMGQVKKKHIQKASKAKKSASLPTTSHARHGGDVAGDSSSSPKDTTLASLNKQLSNRFQNMFFHTAKPKAPAARKKLSDSSVTVGKDAAAVSGSGSAPPVGEMKRFASGRETFANFDWRAQIAPEEIDQRGCYTDDERMGSDAEEEEEEEDEVIIPFSAPLAGGGGGRGGSALNLTPRKEINIWKRRTMAPPRPLQLKPVLTAK